ncbi:serine/threonine protein kinase [Actinoallomurus sp. NBC_01490]|uniref:serine/threonine-protein kinase n=1 Tax=Actinoallomurus sp. NBC_01490 TaxID=2903557 RepID=UPI002E35E71E|nr:serine/threonine-protein kinase [Actinoallomurus sp. NBC_01490]
MTVRIGALVAGRYRVERQIGSGGMGAVWLARDERLDRPVALKRAHPAADERRLRELSREARIVGGIDHPRVVTLYDLVTEDAATWLVMEYVPSRDLADVIASDGVLSPEAVTRIGRHLADALAAVHAQGIVHGDVKPANVLITESGDAKLTDFGVSRALWADETVSDSGLFRGTPAYVAPEVARGAKPLPAADVFSLGATLFAAAEGESPLGDGGGPMTAVWRSASGHVAAPTAPGALGAALSAMLRLDPDDRPDAAEAGRLLESGDAVPPPRPVKPRRVGRVAVAAAVATVVLASAATVMIVRASRSSSADAPARSAGPPASGVGDPRTAEPCALVDPASLRRFGGTELSTDYGNFNRCDVLIQRGDDDLADVKVELENGPAPEPGSRDRVERRGTVGIIREPLGDGECDEELTLADGHVVAVAAQRTGPGPIDLCAAATVATDRAAAVLARGVMPRRARPLPSASLGRLDACALLTRAALSRVGAGRADPGFARWDCHWKGTGGTGVQLRFDRNGPLTADDGTPVRLAGHAAFIQPGGDGHGTCVAQVTHRTYTDTGGHTTAEIVFLVVSGSRSESRLCADAKALASSAAAGLPKA